MPKLKKSTKKLRAQNLTKAYIRSNLNQSKLARRKGVTRQTIHRKIHSEAVQDVLSKFLESPELKDALTAVAQDGLLATKICGATILVDKKGRVIKPKDDYGGIEITDHNARHRFWHDLMKIKGHLKDAGNGPVVQVFVGSEVVTRIKELEDGQIRSKSDRRLEP